MNHSFGPGDFSWSPGKARMGAVGSRVEGGEAERTDRMGMDDSGPSASVVTKVTGTWGGER